MKLMSPGFFYAYCFSSPVCKRCCILSTDFLTKFYQSFPTVYFFSKVCTFLLSFCNLLLLLHSHYSLLLKCLLILLVLTPLAVLHSIFTCFPCCILPYAKFIRVISNLYWKQAATVRCNTGYSKPTDKKRSKTKDVCCLPASLISTQSINLYSFKLLKWLD